MKRRTLLECAIRLASLQTGVHLFSAWMAAAQTEHHAHASAPPDDPSMFANYQPAFFGAADFEALQALTELLIPTDDVPGAREAHCASFIDFVLRSSQEFSPETGKQWHEAMKAFQDAGFQTANADGRAKILAEIAKPDSDPSARHPAYPAYRLIKRENAFAFYTARAGMIEALDYRGNSYNLVFPACTHPEHHEI